MMQEKSLKDFIEVLASNAPTPGGGGASALVGSIGCALGSMVGNLTIGNKKYADVQEDIKELLIRGNRLQSELLLLIDKDAEGFEPLAKAYGLPRKTQEEKEIRNKIMEEALSEACQVPIKIMETIYEVILLHEELAKKGTKIAISDVAAGVQLCRSSLYSASVNVFINTKSMKNPKTAQELNLRANNLLEKGIKKADTIFYEVFDTLRPDKQGE